MFCLSIKQWILKLFHTNAPLFPNRFDFRTPTMIIQALRSYQDFSRVQETKSYCTGTTLSNKRSGIGSLVRLTPLTLQIKTNLVHLYSKLLAETFLRMMFFFQSSDGIHIIKRVQQVRGKARSTFTIYNRLPHYFTMNIGMAITLQMLWIPAENQYHSRIYSKSNILRKKCLYHWGK